MSACLFTLNRKELESESIESLCEMRDKLFQILAIKPDINNKFECDKWAGSNDSLMFIFLELYRREEKLHAN